MDDGLGLVGTDVNSGVLRFAFGISELADGIEARPWAADAGNWAYLARLDQLLLKAGVVPERPAL